MEKPTYTREQLQQLPAVVAKRQLDENIKRAVNYIESCVVTEAKKGNTSHTYTVMTPPEIADEIIRQLRVTLKDDITITYNKSETITIEWD